MLDVSEERRLAFVPGAVSAEGGRSNVVHRALIKSGIDCNNVLLVMACPLSRIEQKVFRSRQ
jgi:hypothetical protein